MKCFNHPQMDAVAVCMNCGRALCVSCTMTSETGKAVCSPKCGGALKEFELILRQACESGLKGWKVLAYFIFAVTAIFAIFGGVAALAGDWPIVGFLAAIVVVFSIVGCACLKLGRRD